MPRSKAPVTPVVWTFSALADIEGIRRYIGNFNPHAARDMAERIIEAGKEAGETTLTNYEKALKTIASTIDKTGAKATTAAPASFH